MKLNVACLVMLKAPQNKHLEKFSWNVSFLKSQPDYLALLASQGERHVVLLYSWRRQTSLQITMRFVGTVPNKALRSQTAGLLVPRISKSRMGDRAFRYLAPLLSNKLPVEVWGKNLFTFKITFEKQNYFE